MWKWIAGGVLVLMVLVMGICYYGLKKFTEAGGSTVVMVGASPDRVFATLADPDSLSTWVDVGSMVSSSRHGPAFSDVERFLTGRLSGSL